MKTFEMMKTAEKTGKTYKFRSLCFNTKNGFTGDTSGKPYPAATFSYFNDLFEITEWEEVKQPVPWQEVLEAWANDCTIELSIGGERFRLRKRDGALALSQEDILYGAWYILDEEEINE